MSDSQISIKEIRKKFIQVIILEFSPILIFSWLEKWLESLPEAISFLNVLFAFMVLLYGYGLCCELADDYAQYKGYKNHFYIYSILNIFGLSILFLLKNRNLSNDLEIDRKPLLNFSISSIFISLFAISIAFTPLVILVAICLAGVKGFEEYISKNENFSAIFNTLISIIWAWYIIREFKRANINYKFIFGSFKRIDFKLPIGLTIAEYLFAGGMNSIILYGLSFIVPKYVEYELNQKHATSPVGWIGFAIGALLFAPLIEELLFRGIIFQKLAIQKSIIKGLLISAIAFAIIHFRYDVIPLFITGVIYTILYLKTKQLATSILCHFFYNFIVTVRNIYHQFYSGIEPDLKITVAEYQQQFLDNWKLDILFIALSTPYLCYFIYKNFPRNYDIKQLPYFTNQKIFDSQ
ncbi:MAG: lysostaphin resistance A-like protein [Waterburya sp.]